MKYGILACHARTVVYDTVGELTNGVLAIMSKTTCTGEMP